jgi:hypothetical protein
MSFLKHNSWGRTRSPKNIAGPPGSVITLEADTTNLASGASGYKLTGYATENQRYLHVLVTDANVAAPAAVTVFGYCHAFERWFEVPQAFDPVGANAGPTAASIAVSDSAAAPTAQTPSQTEYRVYQIAGIDRVAFVGVDADVDVYAACSTF